MNAIIGCLLFIVLAFLSGLHFYWGIGGKWGISASVPSNEQHKRVLNPGPVACFAVGFALLAMGVFILAEARIIIIALPDLLDDFGLCVIAAIFLLRAVGEFNYIGFFKRIKGTNFADADTRYFSPLCILISLLVSLLEINK